ncbi:hypothetical protein SISNIDRAFT_282726 [Sistotremastrum niveocremeum HHB9708]|uniref:Uncharacterized protein n=1 Tax=Sistotremastrum niveocremeum HHB9708 TaxID=1314777 RepID=A0A164Y8A0_9AGAM|nr:hypothetical protein SISNIDRAFT_282726 [Sistotremastrum niveocremeum HHB9708]
MQQSEVCGIISALNALDQHRNVVLQPLADIINDSENLFFLASDVNRAKASYVQLAIGNQVIKSSENQFFIAMESYLRTAEVASASRKVAGQCDAEIATIVNHATALAATFPAPPPAGTRAQGEQILQNNLRAALKAHADQKADEKITVVNLWNRALLGKVVNE